MERAETKKKEAKEVKKSLPKVTERNTQWSRRTKILLVLTVLLEFAGIVLLSVLVSLQSNTINMLLGVPGPMVSTTMDLNGTAYSVAKGEYYDENGELLIYRSPNFILEIRSSLALNTPGSYDIIQDKISIEYTAEGVLYIFTAGELHFIDEERLLIIGQGDGWEFTMEITSPSKILSDPNYSLTPTPQPQILPGSII